MLRKAAAFLKKDFLMESSYRFAFAFSIFGILVSVLSYFFIDRLFGSRVAPQLEEFGVNYFSYVLLSMAFFGYIGVGLGSFSSRLSSEQTEGTLEAVLMTPTRVTTILLSMVLWNLVIATVDMVIYILLGAFLFKIDFSNINLLSASVVMVLSVISFASLGILSASFIMVFKRGNPVGWVLSNVEGLLGGVYFPVTVLPGWLQAVANCFPITYAVRAFQLSVYRGFTVFQLFREIGILALFCVVLLPLGVSAFGFALGKARRDGSLAQH